MLAPPDVQSPHSAAIDPPWHRRVRSRIDTVLGTLIAVLLATMVVDVLWQVVSRDVLGAPSPWSEELARYLLVWLTLFGAAYAVGQQRHLAIDWLPGRATGKRRLRLAMLSHFMVALFALIVLVVGGGSLAGLVHRLGQHSAALGLPLALLYAALPLSGLLTMAYAGLDLLELRAGEPTLPEPALPSGPLRSPRR